MESKNEARITDIVFSITFVVLLFVFYFCITSDVAKGCGTERWKVKTLGDANANEVDPNPVTTTVSALNAFQAPTKKDLLAASDSRFDPEKVTYQVQVTLVGFKLEADEDFHIVVTDGTKTMVIEVPSPNCVNGPLKQTAANFRASFEKMYGQVKPRFRNVAIHKLKMEVEGVGFFDFLHGQTGVADNGFELHPALSWRELF